MFKKGKKTKIVSTMTFKTHVLYEPIMETPVEYPSGWFTQNGNEGKKPPLHIRLSTKSDLNTSRSWAYAVIMGSSSEVYSVIEYLYHVMGTMKGSVVGEWKSYGVNIGTGEITPLSLIAVTHAQKPSAPVITNPVTLSEADDVGLVMYITGLVRLARTHERHRDIVAERISPLITSVVSRAFVARITTNVANGNSIASLAEIDVLMSALDMFLEKFPKHEFAKARVGTIIMRHVGFSAYSDLAYFKSIVGCTELEDAIEWIMTPAAGLEITQMVLCEEELEDSNSYLPYAMGLQVIKKSPFSASANPNLHFIIHVVGCLFGNDRSVNAVVVKNVNTRPCAINAVIIFLKSKGTSILIKQYLKKENFAKYEEDLIRKLRDLKIPITDPKKDSKDKDEEVEGAIGGKKMDEDEEEDYSSDDDSDDGPIDHTGYTSAYEAALLYWGTGYKFTETELEVIRVASERIEEPREGSVGKWVKNHLLSTVQSA